MTVAAATVGYTELMNAEMLGRDAVLAHLNDAAAGAAVTVVREVDSTNARLLARGRHAEVCIAEVQTAGRGRLGRTWHAAAGSSVLLSLAWKFAPAAALSGLSLAAAVGVCRALESLGVTEVGVKWPNDLVAAGRGKVGGILVQSRAMGGGVLAVVGVGVNVSFGGAESGHGGVDLAALGCKVDRNRLAAAVVNEWCAVFAKFAAQGFGAFRDGWLARHVYAGAAVVTADGRRGRIKTVDATGALVVDDDGGGFTVSGGEVRLVES